MMWAACILFWMWSCVITVCAFDPIRQGNIYIIHQMMQYGADLRLIDLQRKTSLHHAVTGGSMWVEETEHHKMCCLGFIFVWLHSHTHNIYIMHALTVSYVSQCCNTLFVGDRNVPVLRHRHVPCDTASPGCIHGQHRGGPVFAQRPGRILYSV